MEKNNFKKIDEYAIYCTKEQTKKAVELGAQPEIIDSQERLEKNHERIRDTYGIHSCEYKNATYYLVEVRYKNSPNIVVVNQVAYKLPTAEQMIGWLEEKGVWIHFCKPNQRPTLLSYSVSNINEPFRRVFVGGEFSSREEATLSAIDAALEYLR